jgi:hypothetical protein
MPEENHENVPGTWAHALREHFNAFTLHCWRGFDASCELMREIGHENKIDRYKWRDYVLWDMKRMHDEEVKKRDINEIH